MKEYQDLENRIRQIGHEIYSQAIVNTPSLFDKRRWEGNILNWAMRDDAFKTRLFRFIDLLPSLKSDTSVIRLLKEYFSDENSSTPLLEKGGKGMFNIGLHHIPEKGLITKATAAAIRLNIRLMASQFIAGANPHEALNTFEKLREDGYAFSVYLLGELVVSDKEAREYVARYIDLLDLLSNLNISIKVSSLYSQLDPIDWEGSIENTKNNLRPIFKKAKQLGASITFDMENYYYKDLLFAIFKSILEEEEFSDYNSAGIALQAYLKDAEQDLSSLIDWARRNNKNITIRLVKGAYWDYETVINRQKGWPVPVFLNKAETDLNYETLTKTLIENRDLIRPAIATHNIRSIAFAIAVSEASNLTPGSIEFQMLHGMAEPVREAVKKMGCSVRVYTPVGELLPGMGYLVRRLLENTSNESFLRRSFVEMTPFEELIKPPIPQIPLNPPLLKGERGKLKGGFENFRNEPETDFSKSESREKMQNSIKNIKTGFNKLYPIIIAGKEVWTDREILSSNPAKPEETVGRVSSATKKEADMAVEEARKAWETWKRVAPQERAGCLFKIAEKMRKERFDLAALQVYEVGKTWKEADSDVAEAIDCLNYYGAEILRLSSRRMGDYAGEVNDYFYNPKGIGVIISPWNFPLAIPTGMVSASIVAGNCAILKPSGLSPVTGWRLVELFNSAGFPPGVLQYIPGSGKEIGEHLVSHPDIDFIAFTGSKEVGLRIIELAGRTSPGQRNVKKVIAEMGGKNAIIIDETADIDEAIKGVMGSAFSYQGQKCSACSRVIVLEDIYGEFCDRFKEAVNSINIGPPENPGNFMGPVIDGDALKKIKGYITIGEEEGKLFLLRTVAGGGGGNFIGPALFTDISAGSRVAQEEIFGPVVCILKAQDIDSAFKIANSTPYALTGGLFSRSPANIEKARTEFRVGNLYINRNITGALVGRQPFGGSGMSGAGSKAGGPDYLLQFTNPVCITENTLRKGFAPKK